MKFVGTLGADGSNPTQLRQSLSLPLTTAKEDSGQLKFPAAKYRLAIIGKSSALSSERSSALVCRQELSASTKLKLAKSAGQLGFIGL